MNEQSLLARSIRTILMAGVSSAFIAAPALAQDAQQDDQDVVVSASGQEVVQSENAQVEERIQVTGSRIGCNGAEAPSPATVISGDDLVETYNNIGIPSRLPALATTFTLLTQAVSSRQVSVH